MHTLTALHSSEIPRDQLGAIIADYLALERARICRRAFVSRCGLLALVIAVAGAALHSISALASWVAAGVCLVAPAWAWMIELRCDWRLARRLEAIPGVPKKS